MNNKCKALFAGLLIWGLSSTAWASLMGDNVTVNYASSPSPQTVTVVTPGVEFPSASLSTFVVGGGTAPRWAIDIESNFMTIDILATATYGVGASFTFSDLDWVNPGPGVTGVTATTTNAVIPVSATFMNDQVRVFFGSNTDNWQQGDQIRVDLQTTHNVPEPASLALLGLGLAGICFARHKKLIA